MKKIIPLIFLLTTFTIIPAHADSSDKEKSAKKEESAKQKGACRCPASSESSEHSIGIGAVIGAPTGFSLNIFTTPNQSIHNVAGWYLSNDEREFVLTSHYTWRREFGSNKQTGWFYGLGGSILLLDKTNADNIEGNEYELGPSATLGLVYDLKPMELFAKTNLTLNFIQNTEFRTDLMVGLNYNF